MAWIFVYLVIKFQTLNCYSLYRLLFINALKKEGSKAEETFEAITYNVYVTKFHHENSLASISELQKSGVYSCFHGFIFVSYLSSS